MSMICILTSPCRPMTCLCIIHSCARHHNSPPVCQEVEGSLDCLLQLSLVCQTLATSHKGSEPVDDVFLKASKLCCRCVGVGIAANDSHGRKRKVFLPSICIILILLISSWRAGLPVAMVQGLTLLEIVLPVPIFQLHKQQSFSHAASE